MIADDEEKAGGVDDKMGGSADCAAVEMAVGGVVKGLERLGCSEDALAFYEEHQPVLIQTAPDLAHILRRERDDVTMLVAVREHRR